MVGIIEVCDCWDYLSDRPTGVLVSWIVLITEAIECLKCPSLPKQWIIRISKSIGCQGSQGKGIFGMQSNQWLGLLK